MTIEQLAQQIPLIGAQCGLSDVNFDTECLYDLGNLSALLQLILDECLPELPVRIREELSPDKSQFVATFATD